MAISMTSTTLTGHMKMIGAQPAPTPTEALDALIAANLGGERFDLTDLSLLGNPTNGGTVGRWEGHNGQFDMVADTGEEPTYNSTLPSVEMDTLKAYNMVDAGGIFDATPTTPFAYSSILYGVQVQHPLGGVGLRVESLSWGYWILDSDASNVYWTSSINGYDDTSDPWATTSGDITSGMWQLMTTGDKMKCFDNVGAQVSNGGFGVFSNQTGGMREIRSSTTSLRKTRAAIVYGTTEFSAGDVAILQAWLSIGNT